MARPKTPPRGLDELEQHLLGRWADLRLAHEAALATGYDFMACPDPDPRKAAQVVTEMVRLLELAPAPRYTGRSRWAGD